MSTIHGTFTLTEAARLIGVTSAFINRIQKETGIGGEIGTKGRLASFSGDDIEVFKKIKILRMLGFRFKEIKEMWDTEQKLFVAWRSIVIQKAIGSELENDEKYIPTIFPLIIHHLLIEVRAFPATADDKARKAKENEITSQFYKLADKMVVFSEVVRERMETVLDIQARLLDRNDPRLSLLKEEFKYWANRKDNIE